MARASVKTGSTLCWPEVNNVIFTTDTIRITQEDESARIIHYVFSLNWTWDDFYIIKAQADSWLDRQSEDIALIFDFSQAPGVPFQFLYHGSRAVRTRHPRGTPIIFVINQNFAISIMNIIRRVNESMSRDFFIVATLGEAVTMIQSLRGQTGTSP